MYLSRNIAKVIKSKRLIWVENVASMEGRSTLKILIGKPMERDPQGGLVLDGEGNFRIYITEIVGQYEELY